MWLTDSPLSLFPKSQFFYCKVSRLILFFSQLEVNYALVPQFFPLGAPCGPCDAGGEYPAISLKHMTQMTCCLFEHPLWDQRPGHGTWSAPKSFSSRQDRAMLSATHSQHGSNSASQGRGPVAATFVQLGFGNAAKDIALGPQRPSCTKKCCSLFQLL